MWDVNGDDVCDASVDDKHKIFACMEDEILEMDLRFPDRYFSFYHTCED